MITLPLSQITRPMMEALDAFVQQHLGTPWIDECWDLTRGSDCWIWLHHCYRVVGITLPRNVWAAKPLFLAVPPPGAPGDVLHFWPPGAPREHLAIKLRGTLFSDCNWSGSGVAIHDLTRPPWAESLKGAWRYIGVPQCI